MGSGESKAAGSRDSALIVTDYRRAPPQEAPCGSVGLENYGNTCYINSVIQLLYSCEALRSYLTSPETPLNGLPPEDSVLFSLGDLFASMQRSHKRKKGYIGPQNFIQKVKRANAMFRNNQQQDAHEFALFVVSQLVETERSLLKVKPGVASRIEAMFGGKFAVETCCLDCESKVVRQESFIDWSVDIEQSSSLRRCIENFSRPEFLVGSEKFHCEACCAPAPGRHCISVEAAPGEAIIIHLKRFKFSEDLQQFKKLAWHVALPSEILIHTAVTDRDSAHFALRSFVVHQGVGPHLGHYFTVAKVGTQWKRYDDDLVVDISERDIWQYFGVPCAADGAVTATAYILLYERVVKHL